MSIVIAAKQGRKTMNMKLNYFQELVGSMNFQEDIPKDERRKLLKAGKIISLRRSEFFLQAGEIPERMGYIISGLLRLYYIDESGAEINKHFCLENTLAVSYGAFLRREESIIYIQALEDTKLFVIDYEMYVELLNSHICWQKVARKLAEVIFILGQKREHELLLNDAQERYLHFLDDYPNLVNRINQYHIASYIGITPESLSRIRTNLKQN
ncbi:MAG: Crp/Fnr family transcriptional regulator [Rubrobacteridae bacterium]|nr:Crp/Fnr family transcriptional regulator [Rubrobacteridae bacterium]